jgi:hypothetical protein
MRPGAFQGHRVRRWKTKKRASFSTQSFFFFLLKEEEEDRGGMRKDWRGGQEKTLQKWCRTEDMVHGA